MTDNNVKIEAVINGRPCFEIKSFLEKYADLCFFVKQNEQFFDSVFSTPESTARFLNALKWTVLYVTSEKKYFLQEAKPEKDKNKKTDEKELYKLVDIDLLNLPPRGYNCLRRAGYNTLGDIVDTPISELRKIRNLGDRTLEEIIKCCEIYISEHGKEEQEIEETQE